VKGSFCWSGLQGEPGKGKMSVGLEMSSASKFMLTRCHRGHHAPNIADILPMPPAVSQSACLPICQFVLSVGRSADISVYKSICLYFSFQTLSLPSCNFVCQSACLPVRLSPVLSAYLSVHAPICLSGCQHVCPCPYC